MCPFPRAPKSKQSAPSRARYQRKPPSHSSRSHLCLPDPLDSLCDTHIVRLELVQSHADGDGCQVQGPPECLVEAGPAALGDVVGDDLLEAHVRVEEDGTAEDRIGERVEGPGGERGDGEGDERCGEEALGGPVVGAVGGVGLRDEGRVVY